MAVKLTSAEGKDTVTRDSDFCYNNRTSPEKLQNHRFLKIHLRAEGAEIPK